MNENKNPWVVVGVEDFYIVARNGSNGTPDMVNRRYDNWHDAQERADRMNSDILRVILKLARERRGENETNQ